MNIIKSLVLTGLISTFYCTATAGVHSADAPPFTLNTFHVAYTGEESSPFLVNTLDIATTTLDDDQGLPFVLDTGGETGNRGAVTGLVRDLETYLPISGAQLKLQPGGYTATGGSDIDGLFWINFIPINTGYQLEITAQRYETKVVNDVGVFIDQTTIVDVLLGPSNTPLPSEGLVAGYIRNSIGEPLDSVVLTLLPGSFVDTTDQIGGYQIGSIPPGQYLLSMTRDRYVRKDTTVSVAAGSVTQIYLIMHEQVLISVTAIEEDGVLIPNAIVTMFDSTHQVIDCVYVAGSGNREDSPIGAFSFPGTVNNRYFVESNASGFVPRTLDFTISNSTPAFIDVEVPMPRIQVSEPTFVFLIRGISKRPEISNDGGSLWDNFVDSFEERYGGNTSITRITINPVASLESNYQDLSNQIESTMENETDAKIILVGHSMGGIIARYYVAFGSRPVERIFTIDTPHLGSEWATQRHGVHNACYYYPENSEYHCDELPYPAYLEITPYMMSVINEFTLLPLESSPSIQTEYTLIASTHDEEGGDGDWIVNLNSQRAIGENDTSIFESFKNRVVDKVFDCANWIFCHNHAPKNNEVISYILDNLDTPIVDLQTNELKYRKPSKPDPAMIWNRSFILQSGIQYADTFYIPEVAYFEISTVGNSLLDNWTLESPQGETLQDSTDFVGIGGLFGKDSEDGSIWGVVPTPSSGYWILHMDFGSSLDSILTITHVRAPAPIRIDIADQAVQHRSGYPFLLSVLTSSASGVTIDSMRAEFISRGISFLINDSGLMGDETADDGIWSALSDTLRDTGEYQIRVIAFGHAGTEVYRLECTTELGVSQIAACLLDSTVWETMDNDENMLFEALSALQFIDVDSSSYYQLSATLVDSIGRYVSTAISEDSMGVGINSLSLHFNGKHIADHRTSGPFVLRNLRLFKHNHGESIPLQYVDSMAVSPPYSFTQFEGRPAVVQNVCAIRNGEVIEVFWTPHSDPDIELLRIYYDDDDSEPPYEGTGIIEGNSPISVQPGLSFDLSGADSTYSFTISMTAVDSAGSESEFSSPYTVFALTDPDPVDDLTILRTGDNYILTWNPVIAGARYRIETAPSVDGSWTAIANTYATSYERSIPAQSDLLFFRVIAER